MPEYESELLCVADVANELAIKPIEAQRLIARKVLAATQIGDGSFRVAADDLTGYVQGGAADLRQPPREPLLAYVQQFEAAMKAAAADQFLTDDRLSVVAAANPNQDGFSFELKLTPALSRIVDSPVQKATFDPDPKTVARFANWGDLYAVDQLRRIVATQQGGGWESSLYASRAAYDAVVTAAFKALVTQALTVKQSVQVPGANGGTRMIQVTYSLPVVTFINGARLTNAAQLAF